MATSRTGTSKYLKARSKLRRQAMQADMPCALCGDHIDWDARSPHPDSFEADHITPARWGGRDTADNLQPTHRRCNRAKSDGTSPRRRTATATTGGRRRNGWFHERTCQPSGACLGHPRRWLPEMHWEGDERPAGDLYA